MHPTMKRKEASDAGGSAAAQETPEAKKARSLTLFDGVAAVLVGKQANIQFSIQKQNFVKQGGRAVAESASESATHIIYHAASSTTAAALQIRGDRAHIPIVSSQWISECLTKVALLPIEPFAFSPNRVLYAPAPAPTVMVAAASASSSSSSGQASSSKVATTSPPSSPIVSSSSSSASSFSSFASPSAAASSSSSSDLGDLTFLPVSTALATTRATPDFDLHSQGTMHLFRSASVRNASPAAKVACFDLDGTVITTQSGNTFPKSETDWKLLHPTLVAAKMRALVADGFQIVLFTNQKGISTGKATIEGFARKLASIQRALGVPLEAFIATADDHYRKPSPHMWNLMCALRAAAGAAVDRAASFYVGDAAGRAAGWAPGKKKDFSCSDRQFALNVGAAFHTPEALFLGHAEAPFDVGFDPRAFVRDREAQSGAVAVAPSPQVRSGIFQRPLTSLEVVILCGFPGCGKTSYYRRVLQPFGHAHVNRDTLKTPAKCLSVARDALAAGRSVVVDNTNPSIEARAAYVRLAREFPNCRTRCLVFDVPRAAAEHMNEFRTRLSGGAIKAVPSIAYNTFNAGFQAPVAAAEGLASVEHVRFEPAFQSARERALFLQFL